MIRDVHDPMATGHPGYQKQQALLLEIIIGQGWKRWFDIIFRTVTLVDVPKLQEIGIMACWSFYQYILALRLILLLTL